MALQDLTPQLRTRLSRMERAVGWFVMLATLLLVFGFGYYIYSAAARKGWFVKKIMYQTSISSGAGLKEGDPVKLMGFDVGQIARITPNDPGAYYNITVDFLIKAPNYGYLWSDSTVKVAAADLLGHRYIEVTKGKGGVPTVLETNGEAVGMLKRDYLSQRQAELTKQNTNHAQVLSELNAEAAKNPWLFYTNLSRNSVYWLEPEESPALTERLERLVGAAETALPNILNLTNQLATVLSNSAQLTSNLNIVATAARPAVSNLALATAHLGEPGALGEWLLPTNINHKLDAVLGGANTALTGVNTNLTALVQNLGRSLDHLADITSNLNAQVQANTNILSSISRAIVDTDDLVQGLKHHWLFRSAFKHEFTNAPPPQLPPGALQSPKERGAY